MGLFDTLTSAVSGALGGQSGTGNESGAQNILGNLLQQGVGGQSGNIVGQLLGSLAGGQGGAQSGMAGMLETLAASGLGEQVSSWMSNNPNLPISVQQLHDALGSEQVQQMAQQAGIPVGDFLKHLAEHLPQAASDAAGTPAA